MRKLTVILVLVIISLSLIAGCSGKNDQSVDYSDDNNWMATGQDNDKAVDVFYLYPTTYVMGRGEDNIALINNQTMRIGADACFISQASVFKDCANIYAPFYRQADAEYTLSMSIEEQFEVINDIPLGDATHAFEYYLENFNNGRPFILAGHSQGSMVLLSLMEQYLSEHPDVQERMVAAYIIGYSVTDEYLANNPHLHFAEGEADTGVIISYNTEASVVEGNNPVLLEGAISINPITWTRTDEYASKEQSLGSVIFDLDKDTSLKKPHFADAQINLERGTVICSTVDVDEYSSSNEMFGKGVYHSYDYDFYYQDLKANAAIRVETFLQDNINQ
jgi:hypothetical protein